MKTKVIYEGKDPNQKWVAHIAIQTETTPPYVWATYGRGDSLPTLGSDMAILSIQAAKNLFDFEAGKLTDCTQ